MCHLLFIGLVDSDLFGDVRGESQGIKPSGRHGCLKQNYMAVNQRNNVNGKWFFSLLFIFQ